MSERSPTPRPWSVHKFNIRANGGRTPMAYCTASFSMADESLSVDYDAAEANAAFIVHAVNCYDELIAAAEGALECLIGCVVPSGGCDDEQVISNAIGALKSALSKSKEG